MKRIYLITARVLIVAFVIGLCIACEDEINLTGSGIVGTVNFETDVASDFTVAAYSRNYPEGVQTNGVPVGVLGIYDDPIYGKTTASFLSQATLSRFDPDFGDNPVVDSVVLTMPFFVNIREIDDDGNDIFELDSIFGEIAPLNLTIYQSSFFLNDLDPSTGFEEPSVFLSNDISSPSGAIDENLLKSIPLEVALDENGLQIASELEKLTNFAPSSETIILTEPEEDDDGNITFEETERLSPSLRVKLNTDYWQQFIIDQEGTNNLINPNSFNDYFRGLFFDIEPIGDNAFYALFNLTDTNITIYYSFEGDDDSGDDGEPTNDGVGDISINLSGVSMVDYQNEFDPTIVSEIENADQENGEANIYLKGGDGSLAIIDLFGPRIDLGDGEEIQEELEVLRSCGVIVNEANLLLFVDQEDAAAGLGEQEPERVFVYDIDNNSTLLDGAIDGSIGTNGSVDSRTNHLGRLTRTEEGDLTSAGVSYRIRLTQHINNIINNDSTNVRLAVAVSQNVTTDNTSLIAGTGDLETGQRVPVASVISPEGTILHGNLSTNDDKRLKLRIFYTLTEDIDPNSPCGQLLGL